MDGNFVSPPKKKYRSVPPMVPMGSIAGKTQKVIPTSSTSRLLKENATMELTKTHVAHLSHALDSYTARIHHLETEASDWRLEKVELSEKLQALEQTASNECLEQECNALRQDLRLAVNNLEIAKSENERLSVLLNDQEQVKLHLEHDLGLLQSEFASKEEETALRVHELQLQLKQKNDEVREQKDLHEALDIKCSKVIEESSGMSHQIVDLEQALNDLKAANLAQQEEIKTMAQQNNSLIQSINDYDKIAGASSISLGECQKKLDTTQSELDKCVRKIAEVESRTVEYQQKIRESEAKISDLQYQLRDKQAKLMEGDVLRMQAESEIEEITTQFRLMKNQLAISDMKVRSLESSQDQTLNNAIYQRGMAEAALDEIKEALDIQRKTSHRLLTQLQDIKGSIRVIARIRPSYGARSCLKHTFNSVEIVNRPNGDSAAKKAMFEFDRVFGPEASNPEIFQEIEYLVQTALDGGRICVFAYGQTGSGKTYTMNGSDGVIIQTLKLVLASTKNGGCFSYEFTAESVEIYNETIVNLIPPTRKSIARLNISSPAKRKSNEPASITVQRNATSGYLEMCGTHKVPVSSIEDCENVLEQVSRQRRAAATASNKNSSRSHFVFILHIKRTDAKTGEVMTGAINLIDLAGSERVSQSQVQGVHLVEAQNINKSLSCLSDVILAMTEPNRTHVPFRNSKLTYLLQDSLSGNAKTLMLVNLSPEPDHSQESLSTLRFAAKTQEAKVRR